eukprot:TRINITY_DN33821_c0_g1_i1.p1 TRINITY_DN33821_c0_g1~~TRINITY_DN33821_c0_g1_i1.p1  ORF type:complete len:425 (+),score=102.53 TRINITY_DN33821_c0_g1_i1:65-1339(+)
MKRLFSLCFGDKVENEPYEYEDPLLSDSEEQDTEVPLFFDSDEVDIMCVLVCTVAAGIAMCQGEGRDQRLVELELAHKQLKDSQEQRIHELSSIKQELTAAVTTNNVVLNYVVSKVEEEEGIEANPSQSLKERTSRVERALSLSANKEAHSRFGLQKKKKTHSSLRGWNTTRYIRDEASHTDHDILKHTKAFPNFEELPIQDTDRPQAQPMLLPFYSVPRLGPVGVRPSHVSKTAAEVIPASPEHSLSVVVQHPSWTGFGRTTNFESLKANAFLQLVGTAKDVQGKWLPSSRLLVEVNIDLTQLLMNASNTGYLVWDTNGLLLSIDNLENSESDASDTTTDVDVAVDPNSLKRSYLVMSYSEDFKAIAKRLRASAYPVSLVIPVAPYKYDVTFRRPIPTTQQVVALCKEFGWKLLGPSINGEMY